MSSEDGLQVLRGTEPRVPGGKNARRRGLLTPLSGRPFAKTNNYILAPPPRKRYIKDIEPSEMVRLMQTYGPETCGMFWDVKENGEYLDSLPFEHRQRQAICRKFVRWFPSFFVRFRYCVNTGKYEPVIGEKDEICRRKARRSVARRRS